MSASVPDQALAVPVEPVARLDPSGFDPSRDELRSLTKPQLRILLKTAEIRGNAVRGHMVTGTQWPPVTKLRRLGLIYIDRHVGYFGRETMWLKPTDKGRAWADASQEQEQKA